MTKYFHVSPKTWSAGEAIEPGSLGTTTLGCLQTGCISPTPDMHGDPGIAPHLAFMLMREAAVEAVRLAGYPNAPSTVAVCFRDGDHEVERCERRQAFRVEIGGFSGADGTKKVTLSIDQCDSANDTTAAYQTATPGTSRPLPRPSEWRPLIVAGGFAEMAVAVIGAEIHLVVSGHATAGSNIFAIARTALSILRRDRGILSSRRRIGEA